MATSKETFMKSIVFALAAAFIALSVEAHTPLTSSIPAEGSSVRPPLDALVLEFGSAVRLTAITLADSAGAGKKLDPIPTAIAAKFTIAVRDELSPGRYVATWRAVGADTHVISGEIHFEIATPSSH
jgi:methionine-rich copper-binding protein CopC